MHRRALLAALGAGAGASFAGCQSPRRSDGRSAPECPSTTAVRATYRVDGSRGNETVERFRPTTEVETELWGTPDDEDVLGVNAPPAADDERLYVPRVGSVEARRAGSGSLDWRTSLDGDLHTAPALGCGSVFVATTAATYRLRASDGSVAWKRDADNGFALDASPIAADETLFTTGSGTGLVAFAPDGDTRWEATFDAAVSGLAVSDAVYVALDAHDGDGNGGVVALDPADGTRRWRYDSGKPDCGPVVGARGVYVVGAYGRLSALDADGEVRWERTFDRSPAAPPTPAHDTLYIDAGDGEECRALDPETGARRWTVRTGSTTCGMLATPEHVLATGANSGLHVLDPDDGTRLRSYPSVRFAERGLVVSNGSVYFRPSSGTELYRCFPTGSA